MISNVFFFFFFLAQKAKHGKIISLCVIQQYCCLMSFDLLFRYVCLQLVQLPPLFSLMRATWQYLNTSLISCLVYYRWAFTVCLKFHPFCYPWCLIWPFFQIRSWSQYLVLQHKNCFCALIGKCLDVYLDHD